MYLCVQTAIALLAPSRSSPIIYSPISSGLTSLVFMEVDIRPLLRTYIRSVISNNSSNYFEYVSVADRMYEPVKRENKIKVVTTTLNVKASGF